MNEYIDALWIAIFWKGNVTGANTATNKMFIYFIEHVGGDFITG